MEPFAETQAEDSPQPPPDPSVARETRCPPSEPTLLVLPLDSPLPKPSKPTARAKHFPGARSDATTAGVKRKHPLIAGAPDRMTEEAPKSPPEPLLEARSESFLQYRPTLSFEEQCLTLASLSEAVPRKYWDKDEGDNWFVMLGQTTRLTNRLTRLTEACPSFCQAVTDFVRNAMPEPVPFTCISIRVGPGRSCHIDARNSFVPSMIVGLNHFRKGRLWIECPQGTVEGWQIQHADIKKGIFHDIMHRPILFSSKTLLHGTEWWQGTERRVLTSWVPQITSQDFPYFNTTLRLYGFLPPLQQLELDQYALSTYYGHYAVKQRHLSSLFTRHLGELRPPLIGPQDIIEVESSDEEDMPEMVTF